MSISNLMLASLGARRQRRPGRRRAAPLISPSSRPKAAYNQSVLDKVATALSGAFTMAELGELVSRRIDLSVEALSLSADPGAAVADVVATAQAQHWLGELIVAALEARPSDPEIIKAANELGVASLSLPDYPAMPAAAAEALAVLQARTCLIEIDGEPRSTGFLIGRDLVLTSAALAVAPDDDAHDVVARFDYRSGETDGVSSPGVSFFAQVLERNEFDTVREGLGYVLLQLSEPAGILPIGHLEAGSVSALRGSDSFAGAGHTLGDRRDARHPPPPWRTAPDGIGRRRPGRDVGAPLLQLPRQYRRRRRRRPLLRRRPGLSRPPPRHDERLRQLRLPRLCHRKGPPSARRSDCGRDGLSHPSQELAV